MYNPRKIPIKIARQKPPKGWSKLNIDASFDGVIQKCGLGGIFRDAKGHWIVGFGKPSYECGSLETEIKALLEGLKMAEEWRMYLLVIETDSVEVIQSILQGNRLYDDIVNECRSLMHQQKEIILQHTFRQGNSVAHHMTRKAKDQFEGKKTFVEAPSYLKCFVEKKLLE
ncbi:uncharacterized protein LOC142181940 [Nicotiana tabacum]|uniref:Uncharacterized protein LOC142181940 n=1 Tax=Nicotiana tabacum TaxID=4097 RepID=A0AC58UQG7_TOBAC